MHCANDRFTAKGRDMLATIVTVPEIDGTFVELEALTGEADLAAALGDVGRSSANCARGMTGSARSFCTVAVS